MSADDPSSEELPLGPAIIAGAVRGLPAGAAGACATALPAYLIGDAGGGPSLLIVLAVAGAAGAALGATLSAGDAASVGARRPLEVRLLAAALAPIAAFAAGASAATAVSGHFGWESSLTPSDLHAAVLLSPVMVGFVAGAAVAGPAEPEGGWEHALYRGACIAAGPTLVLMAMSLSSKTPMGGAGHVGGMVLTVATIGLWTLVHVAVHRASRPLYLAVRAWFEPESTSGS